MGGHRVAWSTGTCGAAQVRPTVWLTSYPKSGNTWFRLLLANLGPTRATPAQINAIDSTETMAGSRTLFDNHALVESSLMYDDAIDDLRPALYRYLATDSYTDPFDPEASYPVRFVKSHDAYTMTRAGQPVMGGAAAAAGALLFVRDPRDVAPSLANHASCSIDDAIAVMGDPTVCFGSLRGEPARQLRQRALGWSGFAASWLDQTDIPVHVVRYEDLHHDPLGTIRAALAFVGWPVEDTAIGRAIRFSAMEEMQRQEADVGFREVMPGAEPGRRFFRRGVVGGWRDELSTAQRQRIERDHLAMMERLGYVPMTTREACSNDSQAK